MLLLAHAPWFRAAAGLDLENLALDQGQLVGDDPHVVKALPLPFLFDLDSLLAMHNLAVEHTWTFKLVALGGVGVQDHFANAQQLVTQGFPLNLPDGSGPGGALDGDLGLQFSKNQCLRAAALNGFMLRGCGGIIVDHRALNAVQYTL